MSEARELERAPGDARRRLVIGAVVVAVVAAGIVFAMTRRDESADTAGDAEAPATGQMAGPRSWMAIRVNATAVIPTR